MAADGFDVLLTLDRGIEHQQNLRTLPLPILVVDSESDDLDDLRLFVPAALAAMAILAPQTVVHGR